MLLLRFSEVLKVGTFSGTFEFIIGAVDRLDAADEGFGAVDALHHLLILPHYLLAA